MPPDLILWGASLWLVLVLAVPKRGLGGLRRRLAETAAGDRHFVFGPPAIAASEPSSVPSRLVGAARSEWLRALELGIPVYALAMIVETWGRQAREVSEERWAHSPSGLLLRHLKGEVSEDNLTRSLGAWGHLLPPRKLALDAPRRYRMPPVDWRRDWEGRAGVAPATDHRSASNGHVAEAPAAQPVPTPGGETLEIQTLGGFRVIAGGADLTSELLGHPILSFIIVYLLVRAIVAPGKPTTRPTIADELFPGLDPQVQRERFRHRLFDLNNLLPEAVAAAVIVQGETLRFNSDGCSVDVLHVLEVADECVRGDGHLSAEVYAAARDALPSGDAEFLPEFTEIERRATGGEGAAADLVREVQRRLESAQLDLLAGLAEYHRVRREPNQAASYLEEALRRDPGRDDLRRRLDVVLAEAGRSDGASTPKQ